MPGAIPGACLIIDASESRVMVERCPLATMKAPNHWQYPRSSEEPIDELPPPRKKLRLSGQDVDDRDARQSMHREPSFADQSMRYVSREAWGNPPYYLSVLDPSDSDLCDTTPNSSLLPDDKNHVAVRNANYIDLCTPDTSVCNDSPPDANMVTEEYVAQCPPIVDESSHMASAHLSGLNTSQSPRGVREVCYGALLDVNTQILQDPETASVGATDGYVRFDVAAQSKHYILRMGAENMASLNERVSAAMVEIKNYSVRYQAFISNENWIAKIGKWKKSARAKTSDQVSASINIYGPEEVADTVGDLLSNAGLYLQAPLRDHLYDGIKYKNPQWLVFSAEGPLEGPEVSERDSEATLPLAIDNGYEAMFDPEFQQRFLEEAIIDSRVKTSLLSHQRQAVDFIRKKETGTLDDSLNLWQLHRPENRLPYYHHVLTKTKKAKPPLEPKGGILADDMGLGKSLTMLASVVGSLDLAQYFRDGHNEIDDGPTFQKPRASATLIVGPSVLILDGWEEETSRHISDGVLKVHKYHGSGKEIDARTLRDYDIVLTTYATIESDLRRNVKFFQSIFWYRVILDEAHVIRTRSTKQFQAAFELTAQMRWCLTGTPIQNRLEDFGSLVSFLKVHALDRPETFRKLIVDPADPKRNSSPDLSNLKKLLSSMCLRRSRHLLSIPEPEIQDVGLELSANEQYVYGMVEGSWKTRLEDARKRGNHTVFKKGFLRKYQSLRMICNHGVHENSKLIPISESNYESQTDETQEDEPRDLLIRCRFCFVDVSTFLVEKGSVTGLHPSCSKSICLQCLPSFSDCLSNVPTQAKGVQCAVCNDHIDVTQSHSISRESVLPELDVLLNQVPTKMAAVVKDIEKNVVNNKSLVFSAWKRSLDILNLLLQQKGIKTYCIHGQLPVPERRRILVEFRENRDARVLLMTFGTGGVGLNLLSVDRIHILEPQWNPAVESQAIGRAVRLGQTKSVTILRYVISNSIEDDHVRSLQSHKLKLAEGFENQPAKHHMDRELEQLM